MKSIIKINDVNVIKKNKSILNNLSFEVPEKTITAFIGPNGAGKTTTIRTILNLFNYKSGSIKIDNLDSKDITSHYLIGYVPEKENFPKIKVYRFLFELALLCKMDKVKIDNQIDYYLKLFGISDLKNSTLTKLSSGQKKKLLIIQAMIHEPKLIIMDEPTENLDPESREIFYNLVKQFHKDGATFLISTHNLDEINNYANHLVIINNGSIAYEGKWKNQQNLRQAYKNFQTSGKFELIQSKDANVRYETLLKEGLLTKQEVEILKKKGKK